MNHFCDLLAQPTKKRLHYEKRVSSSSCNAFGGILLPVYAWRGSKGST